ncbi:MAG TPA: chemotaxis protein CheX [Verrucomicrobiae bacterium]|nr:chemotaxis protein CheX [Verrucomicrobiae bacterium]
MQKATEYQELAKRYGFAPIPESVLQLTQLVSRQDADLDDVAKLVDKDPSLRARLLRVANPDAEDESDYSIDTVEAALMRSGLGCALLLAMGTPLAQALMRAFQAMMSKKLEAVDRNSVPTLQGDHVLGTIGFSGKAVGSVYLRLSTESAQNIAATILGADPNETLDASEINDVIGELLNIMTGNFKSNLCDAGLDCRLSVPTVTCSADLHTPTSRGGGLERMAFRSGAISLFVDVTVNPWGAD